MDIKKLKNIFGRYAEGTANETESALLEAWYSSYTAKEKESKDNAETRRDAVRRNIKAALHKRSIVQLPIFRIAAAIAIFSTIAILISQIGFKKVKYSVVSTGINDLKELTLADGSKVWLNAATRIKVPSAFNGKNREITLEEGDAFFNVTKDAEHPFVVHTTHLKVQVLGTSFNIKAYKGLLTINVAVTTGRVGVTRGEKILATLTPGQELDFKKSAESFILKAIDPIKVQGWKSGATYLHDAGFEELALALKNLYGLQVKAGTTQIAKFKFSLKLTHNLPAQQMLDLIGQLHQTSFRKEGDDIVLY
jgi:ferric-dicitrate binding protein FerR (iron transport regulator)